MVRKCKVYRGGEEKTHIREVEAYRPGRGEATKHRTIKSFGYLEDQADPKAFMAEVEEFNKNYREKNEPMRIAATGTAKMYEEDNRRYNYGYKYIEAIYKTLGIDKYIEVYAKATKYQGKSNLAEIFKFLVINRIMKADSLRATFQMKEGYYGMETEFELADIYRGLDEFSEFEIEIQRHLNEKVKETIGRDLTHAFYDVTNYFFEIDFPDGEDDLRKKGVSKEHRTTPITAMGLFIDSKGLPVNMSIFAGNTSDSLTLRPTMGEVKRSYGLGRLTVVADKGLNSSDNIDDVVNDGDGFLFSQILKGKKGQRYHDKLFSDEDWISNKDEALNKEETYKYKLFEEEYIGKDKKGKKVTRKRKVLLYWDKTDADMARRKREEKLEKAARSVKNNAYSIKKGVDEYTKENIVDKETGELLENTAKKRTVDIEKAEADAMYDGYFCIITSEMDYDEKKMREVYGGLWKIEQSFRILKSDLYARSVFVKTNEHTCNECERARSHAVHANQSRAHFLICFVALLVIRIIQYHMGDNPLSAERISRALNAATCRVFKGGIVHLDDVGGAIAFEKRLDKHGNLVDTLFHSDDDEIALDFKLIQNLFGTDFYNVFHRVESFNKFLNNICVAQH
jgi:transposase